MVFTGPAPRFPPPEPPLAPASGVMSVGATKTVLAAVSVEVLVATFSVIAAWVSAAVVDELVNISEDGGSVCDSESSILPSESSSGSSGSPSPSI